MRPRIPLKKAPAQKPLPTSEPESFTFELPAVYRVEIAASSQDEAKDLLRRFLNWKQEGWADPPPRMLLPGSMAHGVGAQFLIVKSEALK